MEARHYAYQQLGRILKYAIYAYYYNINLIIEEI